MTLEVVDRDRTLTCLIPKRVAVAAHADTGRCQIPKAAQEVDRAALATCLTLRAEAARDLAVCKERERRYVDSDAEHTGNLPHAFGGGNAAINRNALLRRIGIDLDSCRRRRYAMGDMGLRCIRRAWCVSGSVVARRLSLKSRSSRNS